MIPPLHKKIYLSGKQERHLTVMVIIFKGDGVRYMDEITPRNEEQAKEEARKQVEKRKRQEELERAKEEARKQAIEQERKRQKAKDSSGTGSKYVIYLVVLALIIAVVAWFSLNVTVTNVTPGNALPFTTNYGVSFPEGQTITIGNTHINVLSYQNEIISDIDGDRQKLVVGEDRIIGERRAVITTLGAITLMDTNFKIDLKYKGQRDNRAYFDMAVHTSKQVPDMLLKQLLPPEIDARPM
jgi:hypothetical protein